MEFLFEEFRVGVKRYERMKGDEWVRLSRGFLSIGFVKYG